MEVEASRYTCTENALARLIASRLKAKGARVQGCPTCSPRSLRRDVGDHEPASEDFQAVKELLVLRVPRTVEILDLPFLSGLTQRRDL